MVCYNYIFLTNRHFFTTKALFCRNAYKLLQHEKHVRYMYRRHCYRSCVKKDTLFRIVVHRLKCRFAVFTCKMEEVFRKPYPCCKKEDKAVDLILLSAFLSNKS